MSPPARMSTTIVLLSLLCLLLGVLLLRPLPPPPPRPPPLQARRVSFSLVSSDTSYALPIAHSAHRRWSSPLHKRKSSALDPPCTPQPDPAHSLVDQFGRILPSTPASDSPKPSRRLSASLRLSFASRRRSSSVSCTSTLIQVDTPASLPAVQSPPQRTKFMNPFAKHSRSKTLPSPAIGICKSPSPGPPRASLLRRPTLLTKFKSIFKSTPPEPSPNIQPKPILTTSFRRKPVARTQPYGPPWNAPMPVPDFTLSQHSFRESTLPTSPSPQSSRKRSVYQSSRPEITPSQLSPHTFISELDEKLSLLQQRIHDSIPSPR